MSPSLRRFARTLVLVAALRGTGTAEEASPDRETVLRSGLASLLPALDSEDPAVRRRAGTQLDDWCTSAAERAVPLLTAAGKTGSIEVAARLRDQLAFLDELASARKLLALFDAFGTPRTAGLKFAEVVTDSWGISGDGTSHFVAFGARRGWIVSSDEKHVVLFASNLQSCDIARDWKPDASDLETWDQYKARPKPDAPKPGDAKELDFEAECGDMRETGWVDAMVARDEKEGGWQFDALTDGQLPWQAAPLLYARWELDAGNSRAAVALVAAARLAAATLQDEERKTPVDEILATAVGTRLRMEAIRRAGDGADRAEVLRLWEGLAAFPKNGWEDEAREFVSSYRSLVAEDRDWKAPTDEALAKLPPAERARVWVHRLRELHESGDPASVHSVDELRKLGWDAVGVLVEHFDDARPTRCTGCWRYYAQDSWGIGKIAKVCQQVFLDITGLDLSNDNHDGVWQPEIDGTTDAEMKTRGVAWWAEASKHSAEEHFVSMLTRHSPVAAHELLRINPAKYKKAVLEQMALGGETAARVLPEIQPLLTPDDAPALRLLLEDKDNPTARLAAGALLEKCSDPSGVDAIAAHLVAGDKKWIEWGQEVTLAFLAGTGRPAALDAYVACVGRTVNNSHDLAYIAPRFVHPRAAEAWAALLERTDLTNCMSGEDWNLLCDNAGDALSRMTGYQPRWTANCKRAQRDQWLVTFRAWWREHAKSLDWEALRRAAPAAK